jgi:hypothetical protein
LSLGQMRGRAHKTWGAVQPADGIPRYPIESNGALHCGPGQCNHAGTVCESLNLKAKNPTCPAGFSELDQPVYSCFCCARIACSLGRAAVAAARYFSGCGVKGGSFGQSRAHVACTAAWPAPLGQMPSLHLDHPLFYLHDVADSPRCPTRVMAHGNALPSQRRKRETRLLAHVTEAPATTLSSCMSSPFKPG